MNSVVRQCSNTNPETAETQMAPAVAAGISIHFSFNWVSPLL